MILTNNYWLLKSFNVHLGRRLPLFLSQNVDPRKESQLALCGEFHAGLCWSILFMLNELAKKETDLLPALIHSPWDQVSPCST